MTGSLSGDEPGGTPTDVPAGPSEVAGEAPGDQDGPSVAVAYMHGSRVSHSWHRSMMDMVAYDKSVGFNLIRQAPFSVSCSGPHGLVEGRNMAVKKFLDEGTEDWLFFVDTDMGFEPSALERLVFAADPVARPVVGGLCFAMKHTGPDGKGGFNVVPIPTLFMWGRTPDQGYGFASRFRFEPNTVTQVAGTGAAFLLMHRSVLDSMRAEKGDTWFNLVQYEDGTNISEDLSFCFRLMQMRIPVFVHTGVSVSHHKELWLSDADYRMPKIEPAQRLADAAKRPECEVHGQPMIPGLKAVVDGKVEQEWHCACTHDAARNQPCAKCGNLSCDGEWGCLPSKKGEHAAG